MDQHANFTADGWSAAADKATFERLNPADSGHVLGKFPRSSPEDVIQACASARKALAQWSRIPASERVALLAAFLETASQSAFELCDLCAMETGQPEPNLEVDGGLQRAREVLTAATIGSDARKPRGVVGVTTPWFSPLASPLVSMVAALATGNAVVVCPAAQTPWCAERLFQDLESTGIPGGACALLQGGTTDLRFTLVNNADVTITLDDGRSSTQLPDRRYQSRNIALEAQTTWSFCIVAEQADLDQAVACSVDGAYRMTGQRPDSFHCIGVARALYVQFVASFVDQSHRIRFDDELRGDGAFAGPMIDLGALNDELQRRDQWRGQGTVLLDGGRLTGSRHRMGLYLGPFVWEATPHLAATMAEARGPSVALIAVDDDEAALNMANAIPRLDSITVCTTDKDVAERFARHSFARSVLWNAPPSALGLPLPETSLFIDAVTLSSDLHHAEFVRRDVSPN